MIEPPEKIDVVVGLPADWSSLSDELKAILLESGHSEGRLAYDARTFDCYVCGQPVKVAVALSEEVPGHVTLCLLCMHEEVRERQQDPLTTVDLCPREVPKQNNVN